MRRCPRCEQVLPREDFGLASYCKPCNRTRAREWQKANPERRRVQAREWKDANREKVRASNLAWYYRRMADDPESIRASRRAWAKTPKGVLANRLARHQRRGAKTDAEYAAILYGDPCSYCGTRSVEIDHITPLRFGGDGRWENLTPACRTHNAAKNDRTLVHFLAERT